MQNLNVLAKDLAIETDMQGNKLKKLDDAMITAENNAT